MPHKWAYQPQPSGASLHLPTPRHGFSSCLEDSFPPLISSWGWKSCQAFRKKLTILLIVQWSGQSLKPRGRKHSNFDDFQIGRLFSRSFAKLKMSTKETFGRYHVISFSAGLHNIHSHDHQNQAVTKLAKISPAAEKFNRSRPAATDMRKNGACENWGSL